MRNGAQAIAGYKLGTQVNVGRVAEMPIDTDASLVERFLGGDTTAFDALFDKYQSYVYRIVYGILGNAAEAQDVTQDVFVQVYRSFHQFNRTARFATWLYRIAVNRSVDRTRSGRKWRWLSLNDDHPDLQNITVPGPEESLAEASIRNQAQTALMHLSIADRQVIVLRYYQELSIEEIAAVLGASVNAIKLRLHRARLRFKAELLAIDGGYLDE